MNIRNSKMTIHELFESQVNLHPDNLAVIYNNESLNYKHFNEKCNQLAHFLQKQGVKAETPVGLCMERSIELLIAMFAILKAGGAYIPLDPSHPEERISSTLNDNQVPFLLLTKDLNEKFRSYQGQTIALDFGELNTYPSANLNTTSQIENLAYIIYTSGSTGKPKGVLIEHQSVVNFCLWFGDFCHCQASQRIDFSSSHAFDMAIANTLVPLMLGMTIVICDDDIKKSPTSYLEFIKANRISVIKLTPSFFRVLLFEVQSNFIALPDLKLIVLGGELLHTLECSSWLARYPHHKLINEYGPTEATVGVSLFRVSNSGLHSLRPDVPIGKPGNNIDFYLLDKDLNPVPTGEVGELYIGGLCLARGYFNQPQITHEKFINSPFKQDSNSRLYKTGDLCRRLTDGNYELLGRIDHQIKIRGFRVELGEIERCIASHPAICEAVVIARPDHLNEKQLIAYFTLKDKQINPGTYQIKQYLKRYLTDYMIPVAFIMIDAFPLNANGKLDREALPIPEFHPNRRYLAPTNELEAALTEIWAEEFNLKPIGIHDNFFELGGHSLIGARILTKINQMLGKNLTIKELYQAPTIAELAVIVSKIKSISQKSHIKNSLATANIIPLSHFQLLLWLSNTFEPKAKKLNIISRKRLQGAFNKEAFNYALTILLKRHEVLSYHICKFKSGQYLQHNLALIPEEIDLQKCEEKQSNLALTNSVFELLNYHLWPKGKPLLRVKIFYLKNNTIELQACLPHIISDGASINVLWSELSKYYLAFNKLESINNIGNDKSYRHYLENELILDGYSAKDHQFWLNYLKNAGFVNFPPQYIVKNMAKAQIPYSTYLELPQKAINRLIQFCAHYHFGLNEALSAILGKALIKICQTKKETIFINIVKSARDNPLYDKTIGCFLKLEPIKLALNQNSSLFNLARQVQKSIIKTAPYQQSPALLKLACVNFKTVSHSRVIHFITKIVMSLYAKLFPSLKLNPNVLSQVANLAAMKKRNKFIINLNVLDNFFHSHKYKKKLPLFSLKNKSIETIQYDLLNIDYFLDVCFLSDYNNTPYLVVSANLLPELRELLSKEIVNIMLNETLEKPSIIKNKIS
ncbi:amino acid adenylation domain-containing protein [Legionella gresilensis]|uniref:amino acid adenylation domain-containing protein n=1 Tax=Legionella gresilensis TaxID=91823 RepID=UPI001041166C|nr:amino acid adenylation domain-containing protein [Legionella gresilensis]